MWQGPGAEDANRIPRGAGRPGRTLRSMSTIIAMAECGSCTREQSRPHGQVQKWTRWGRVEESAASSPRASTVGLH